MVVQVIVFLVDSSSSMNQVSYLGTSLLDIAKNAVESFIKIRNRDSSGRHDRYILVNFDERPYCIKSGWKESHATFSAELKNLKGNAISTLGNSLRECFDYLNIPRLQSATDNYGMGRNPFYIEPACIILLSDGGSFTNLSGVESLLNLPNSGYEGAELTKEPFRWDQRLFSIILRVPGVTPAHSLTPTQFSHLDAQQEINSMCEATGGKSYVAISPKSLTHSLESISTKLQTGVVVNFECMRDPVRNSSRSDNRSSDSSLSETTNISNISCGRKLMYVKANPKTGQFNGHWPIPEEFWPDANSNQLPPRSAHPTIYFDTKESHPLLIENFPFDKYELEPSPLTQYILSRKNTHNSSWQCYVMNSGFKEGTARAFGYLRASSGGKHVNIFVMPYDYPIIIPLLDELSKQNFRPSSQWTQEFNKYLNSIPTYYIQPLKNSLRLFGANSLLIPNSYDGNPSYNIIAYLKKIKRQSESESKRVYTSIPLREVEVSSHNKPVAKRGSVYGLRHTCLDKLRKYRDILTSPHSSTRLSIRDYSIPISQMGNYQEYLSRVPPLREIDICMSRTQLFANPYKLVDISAKNSILDEADEDIEDRYGFKAPTDKRIKSKHKIRPPSPNTPPRSMTPPPLSQFEKQLSWIEKRQTPSNDLNSNYSSLKYSQTSYSDISPSPSLESGYRDNPHRLASNHPASDLSYSQNNLLNSSDTEEPLNSRDEPSCILSDSKNLPANHFNTKRSNPAPFPTTHPKRQKTETMVSESLNFDVIKLKQISLAKEDIRVEIRKSGKNYDNLFKILERLPEVEQRKVLVQEALDWAARFKKRSLIQLLENWKIKIYLN
ncbi:Integrator complex subunit 6-like [Oopsacas minuta]|uniref:Integrator complex subunit 6-like n=1 Tax=Oopsacas minuta TaxID=111878 RepID=A0AAV7JKT8_9METZ|nr:Integrator complex subunit 6-like [Oopsacas minuta]